ncbi:MAG: hypothetical protein U9O98_03765, partial [Asgard group archaeon]|nr:hypothetical protein [Asgard group archaeon]
MSKNTPKNKKKNGIDLIENHPISDVEKRQEKRKKKKDKKEIICSEKQKQDIAEKLKKEIKFSIELNDVLHFLLKQVMPLLFLGSAFFIPGIYYLAQDKYMILLIIIGSLCYGFTVFRFIGALTTRIHFTPEEVSWLFLWKRNNLSVRNVKKIEEEYGYYFYLIVIGGFLRIGIETLKLLLNGKAKWIRLYAFRKKKAEEIVRVAKCWNLLNGKNDV